MYDLIISLIKFLVKYSFGWFFGTRNEIKHLDRLKNAEIEIMEIKLFSNKFHTSSAVGHFISSNAVVSQNFYKSTHATIKNVLCKSLSEHEATADRARREAIIKLKQQAKNLGANEIHGFRLETASILNHGGIIEVIAYGTAIRS